MTSGQKTALIVITIITVVIGSLVAIGSIITRVVIPKVATQALMNEEYEILTTEEREKLDQFLNSAVATLDDYGLSQSEAIKELEGISQWEVYQAIKGFSEDPQETPAEAILFVIDELGIEGLDEDLVSDTIAEAVPQKKYEEYINSPEYGEIDEKTISLMYPVIKEMVLEVLKNYSPHD